MPVIINQINGNLDEDEKSIIKKAIKSVGLKACDIKKSGINKVSLDARKRNNIHFVYSVYIELTDNKIEQKLLNNKQCRLVPDSNLNPVLSKNKKNGEIVIAGFGPAGMFCGLVLAEYGYKPIILERGCDVDTRINDVNSYWNGGSLNVNSNVQFGEGGAGTFSDGKLTTRINDPLCRYVLEKFIEFGAPEEIIIKAKPHIGTDNLRNIVKAIRERIIDLGGKVLFNSKLDDFVIKNNYIDKICYNNLNQIDVSAVVLAIGHSARDTFEMLNSKHIFMQPKPFSVGVRIEHKQSDVNRSLYGKHAGNPRLPVGEYQLSYRNNEGRGVYTFCMCPGGSVVPSASEENTVVTNGMSNFLRDGENANAAIVVSVSEKDYGHDVLDGMYFARKIEQNAFNSANGEKSAPATTVKGFLDDNPTIKSSIVPTYNRGIHACDLNTIFPKTVTDMLKVGLTSFSKKMECFSNGDALLTAPETRTSSPVRITRTEKMNSISAENLFPCGEGAGYAGGIMSAAVDGVKTALTIMSKIGNE